MTTSANTSGSTLIKSALALVVLGSAALMPQAKADTAPSVCPAIQVPQGNVVKFHAYATGVQIYQWNGTAWVFVAPSATLYADPGYHGQVGIHYAGPTLANPQRQQSSRAAPGGLYAGSQLDSLVAADLGVE